MEQSSLFEEMDERPLAERLRPKNLGEFVGQKHLLGEGKVLRRLIESDRVSSMIFRGLSGCGKDYSGKNYCLSYTGKVCGFFCCYQWYQGNSCFDAAG